MKHTLQEVFHSPRFVVGFVIFAFIVLTTVIYPLFVKDPPLAIIAQGTFFEPGIYVSVYDSLSSPQYTLNLEDAQAKRIANKLGSQERQDIQTYLLAAGVSDEEIDIDDTELLLNQWVNNYDPKKKLPGMTYSKQRYFQRLNGSLKGLLSTEGAVIAVKNSETGALEQTGSVPQSAYVNISQVPSVRWLPLGTDNFGRDVLTELVAATRTSLLIGLWAGLVATSIGLVLGLVSGYMGGWVDDFIMFFNNIFIVIPPFVLLILITYSLGQNQRGPMMVATVIGLTSWVWTSRSVRAQVISLRNRDHVNLSRLSGHPIARIIFTDILPYIASYVFMAFILQISSGILSEAGLSILGLGPRTTEVPTLGLMMNWAMIYSAHLMNKWWAYFPVIVVIALIAFSLNLMNTGMDRIYNPSLRE